MSEEMFKLDGVEYLRVRSIARLRMASGCEVPQVGRALASQKETKPYWVDPENPDVVWVNFILDSEADNKNWDYMPRTQLLASYKTARFKPMDMEHVVKEEGSLMFMDRANPSVKNTIFGVMSHAYLSDSDGNALTEKQIKALPKNDDPDRPMNDRVTVSAWAALYYFLFPETVTGVVKAVSTGDMQVSMERWLKEWDFLVKDDGGKRWEVVSRAEAEKNGVSAKWASRQTINGSKILRRSLKYTYGGVASTTNPANVLSRFVDKTSSDALKAAASQNDPAVKILLAQHEQVVSKYALSTVAAEKSQLAAEHESIHRALKILGAA